MKNREQRDARGIPAHHTTKRQTLKVEVVNVLSREDKRRTQKDFRAVHNLKLAQAACHNGRVTGAKLTVDHRAYYVDRRVA